MPRPGQVYCGLTILAGRLDLWSHPRRRIQNKVDGSETIDHVGYSFQCVRLYSIAVVRKPNMNLILIILLLLLVFGGGGGYYYGGPQLGGSIGGIVLIILLVWFLMGRRG